MHAHDLISIGTLAARVGVAVSAVRFYEERGLIQALRSAGGQRRFLRADIRRVSFILIAQRLGLSLAEIAAELARLPHGRTPSAADWRAISEGLRARLDAQIAALVQTRDTLDGCIGCGCLSLERCALYNAGDKAASRGAGPRYLLGDRSGDVAEVGSA
jgi:MerR family transcriptional regulator, redox-sensitive transcriptional activator SoxR